MRRVLLVFIAALATGFANVDGTRIRNADAEPQNWLAHGRTYAEQRFSPLKQIHAGNVSRLGPAWSFLTGTKRGLEATPIVVDGVLYATGTWSVVYALDAATGRLLWRHDPQVPRETGRKACCDVVNRGVAVWKGRVYVGTLDGRLLALDAKTGKPVWEVLTVDRSRPYTITGAPRIVKDRVFIGNGGADLGVRGYFSAYDAKSGRLLWRFYTVPRDPAQPQESQVLEQALSTWSPDSLWESGLGGTVWDSMAYDPELDLLYVGVGNSTPYLRQLRSPGGGDNLFLASILAVRPETGELVWHYQTTPGESWDHTATQHMILAELTIGKRRRKVLMQAPKNGFFYVLDRATGELISAENFVPVSWATHIDLETGRPVEREEASWDQETAWVTPAPPGAHNWMPMAYSPQTGLVYIPSLSIAYPYIPQPDFEFVAGALNTGEDFVELAKYAQPYVGFCSPSHLTAWDPLEQRRVWRVEHTSEIPGGLLATAGNLVFQGSGSGVFAAYSARSGEKLWESAVGVGIMAPPVTYSVRGRQYVAVLAGVGGSLGLNFAKLDSMNEGRLIAYRLDGQAELPASAARPPGKVDVPPLRATPATIERGRALYSVHCGRCHGMKARSSGLLPDLRFSSRAVHGAWPAIVLAGAYRERGMAGYADVLTLEQVEAVHAYVIQQALRGSSRFDHFLRWAGERVCVPAHWLAD